MKFCSEGDLFQEEDLMSNDSHVWNSDVRQFLKDIRTSNFNKLILGHLNVNCIRNKFDLYSKQLKGLIDFLMVSETKVVDSFPEGQFLVKVFIHHIDLTVIKMVEELCFMFGKISWLNY